VAPGDRARAHEILRVLWVIRHSHDRKLKSIVRGLIRADVARLRASQQVTM
jgi:hypothetical protein